jgi:hypothetical protein
VCVLSDKERCQLSKKSIILHFNSSEEEIAQKLKAAPFALTVKIAAAIGHLWQESA